MTIENQMQIKIGSKAAGSYIEYIKHHPVNKLEILARGGNTSKAVYISGIMKEFGYNLADVEIDTVDMGQKEPLAYLMIKMRAKNDIRS